MYWRSFFYNVDRVAVVEGRSGFPVYASAYALLRAGSVRSEINSGSASKVEFRGCFFRG
ncbi:hypothetical protein DES34_102295 [Brevibacillus brevis]|nr:hypothetical protein DES34_102295 [Brevibacillus brevis]VEF92302.1 Uncharacterised protein [Brevibacillus brevis]